jgi:hypothetical protein
MVERDCSSQPLAGWSGSWPCSYWFPVPCSLNSRPPAMSAPPTISNRILSFCQKTLKPAVFGSPPSQSALKRNRRNNAQDDPQKNCLATLCCICWHR